MPLAVSRSDNVQVQDHPMPPKVEPLDKLMMKKPMTEQLKSDKQEQTCEQKDKQRHANHKAMKNVGKRGYRRGTDVEPSTCRRRPDDDHGLQPKATRGRAKWKKQKMKTNWKTKRGDKDEHGSSGIISITPEQQNK